MCVLLFYGTNLMCKIVIWMVDQKKVLHKLTCRFVCVWWNISNKDLRKNKFIRYKVVLSSLFLFSRVDNQKELFAFM